MFIEILKSQLNQIKLSELTDLVKKWYVKKNMAVSIITNDAPNPDVLTQEQIEEALEKNNLYAEAKTDDDIQLKSLMVEFPKAGKLISEEKIAKFGAELWTLSNGAKLVFKGSKLAPGAVGFWAESNGGLSVMPLDLIPSVSYMERVIEQGLGANDKYELKKILSDKELQLVNGVSDLRENLSGSASAKDFETLMQLVYMMFEQPRFDKKELNIMLEEDRENFKKTKENALFQINREVNRIYTDNHERTLIASDEMYDKITPESIEKVYRSRFSNASDWTFYVVGDISKKKLKKQVEKPCVYYKYWETGRVN